MKMRMVKGMAAALCMAMLATTAAAVAPGGAMMASAGSQTPVAPDTSGDNSGGSNPSGGNNNNSTTTKTLEQEKEDALNAFDDWITMNLKTNDPKVGEVDKKIQEGKDLISKLKSTDAVKEQKEKTLKELNNIINGPSFVLTFKSKC